MERKIRSFTDVKAWQSGHKLVLEIYKIVALFPKDELFALTSQMKRSSASVTANIAEGFGRQGYKEKIKFYYISQGSLTELKDQLLIAKALGYISKTEFDSVAKLANTTHKLLIGLIKKSKEFLNQESNI
ncbi:MAG: four helix bundle protein [Candidatus Paceibacterota bacterium]